jgi:hypothetical protein
MISPRISGEIIRIYPIIEHIRMYFICTMY